MITHEKIMKAKPGAVLKDKQVTGLEIYCGKNAKTFRLYYRTHEKRERRLRLGRYPILSIKEARKLAMEYMLQVYKGEDPATSREGITLEEIWHEFNIHHVSKRKQKTRQMYESIWRVHISPAFGSRQAMSIKRNEVAALHQKVGGHQGNRMLSVISKLYSFGFTFQHISNEYNPAQGIERYKEKARKRVATDSELERINSGLDVWMQHEDHRKRQFARLFFTLLFTAGRKSEWINARPEQVDFINSALYLDDSKTGEKTISIPQVCHQVIKDAINDTYEDTIFTYKQHDSTYKLFKKEYELNDLTIHDLRRTYATIAMEAGISIQEISKMLGHSSIKVTESVYAHIREGKGKEISDNISDELIKRLSAS